MKEKKDPRKPYEKPKVSRFPLRPEEAVLGFCKTTVQAGSNGTTCLSVGFCNVPGS